ncbi:MAG: PAS domain S-box protein [Betaproteobacteria bacterium]|nr:PAS domain S-box protein [Betaproteobacteria bacterium]
MAGPGTNTFSERRLRRDDGSMVTVETASVSFLERGRLLVQTVVRDVTEVRMARDRLAEREQRLRDLLEASHEYVWETDADWRYTYLSPRVEEVLGSRRAEMLGRTPPGVHAARRGAHQVRPGSPASPHVASRSATWCTVRSPSPGA